MSPVAAGVLLALVYIGGTAFIWTVALTWVRFRP